MEKDRGLIIEVIGLILVLILGFIEYSKPGDKISFWLLISIAIFIVIFIVYTYIKDKIDILEDIKRKVEMLEQKLTFKNDVHELDKRVSIIEKNAKK